MIRIVLIPFLLIAAFVSIFFFLLVLRAYLRRRAAVKRERVAKSYKNYGHPEPITSAVWKRLPKAPLGYAWQSQIELTQEGDYKFVLALMNVATETYVSPRYTLNLTRSAPNGNQPWDKLYAQFGPHIFTECLVDPMIEGAESLVRKAQVGEVYEYRLGEARK